MLGCDCGGEAAGVSVAGSITLETSTGEERKREGGMEGRVLFLPMK